MKKANFLQKALEYLENGVSVIPMGKDKVPLVKWKEFQERLPTVEEVTRWWKMWPNANIAGLTGAISGFVVVDIDPDKGGDVEEWEAKFGSNMIVKTPRGGAHFYYTHPGGTVRNSVDRVSPGVDIRGDGGYVLLPPSVGSNGNSYSWVSEADLSHPKWLHLNEDRDEEKDKPKEHWLERVLLGVGTGERNDACAKLAGYWLGKKIPKDVVLSQLMAWNAHNKPPMPESEVRQTLESVARTDRDKAKKREGTNSGGGYDVIGLSDYLAKHGGYQNSWLVRDWLPDKTVGMAIAPPGSYKTWLLQDLAVSVASGLPFLGKFPVERPGPVLFMQQEDWHGQIAHRFALIIGRRANLSLPRMDGDIIKMDQYPELPIYLHENASFRFDDEDVVNAWVEQLRRIRPVLVVFDPLYSAGSMDDFMARTAKDMFLFKKLRDELGITFLIAHHTRKSASANGMMRPPEGAPEREDVWGSQFLNAWLETGWQIRRRDVPGTATISRHFKAHHDAMRATLGFNIDTTVAPGRYEVDVKELKPGEKETQGPDIVTVLEKSKKPLSVADLVEATNLHRTTVHRRLDNLTEAGVVKKIGQKYAINDNLEA